MHQMMNLIHVSVDRRHIKNIFARIALIGKSGTNGTINGNFVLEKIKYKNCSPELTCLVEVARFSASNKEVL